MTDAGAAPPDLYPQYCFHLSPTLNKWCHFRAVDIIRLASHPGFQGQDIFFCLNHPIKWARVAGVVVAITELEGKVLYTIDDSSGATIECLLLVAPNRGSSGTANTYNYNKQNNHSKDVTTTERKLPTVDGPIDIGHVIDVRGGINEFRDQKQIRAETIKHLRTTEQEALWWEKAANLRRDVLSRPWVLDPEEVEELRREEEGLSRRHRRTGLERESKRRKLDKQPDDTTIAASDRTRHTGLEREKTRHRRDKQPDDTALDSSARSRRRETGLERPNKQRALDKQPDDTTLTSSSRPRPREQSGLEKQTTCGDRRPVVAAVARASSEGLSRRRETGLERHRAQKTGGEDMSAEDNWVRRQESGLQRQFTKGAEDKTSRRATGLEKQSASSTQIRQRATGLAPRSTMGPANETSRFDFDSYSQIIGLEKQPESQEDEGVGKALTPRRQTTSLEMAHKTKAGAVPSPSGWRRRITGLEKVSVLRAASGIKADAQSRIPSNNRAVSIPVGDKLSEPYIRLPRKTGLEGQAKQADHDAGGTGLNLRHRRTGLERKSRRANVEEYQHGIPETEDTQDRPAKPQRRVTGLERANHRRACAEIEKNTSFSSQNSQDGQEDGNGSEKVSGKHRQWDIGRPENKIMVRGRTRVTGLEKRG